MANILANLPIPNPQALIQSEKLLQLIKTEIAKNNGKIPFSKYMELALYAPELGYYHSSLPKLGPEGDFVTAPEISPLFAKCLARQCQQVFSSLNLSQKSILEFGAGSGLMAADLLMELEQLDELPSHYLILEISPYLRHQQQEILKQKIPHLFSRISWLDRLPPSPLNGIIIANEVLDAMPVCKFRIEESNVYESYVGWNGEQLTWETCTPSLALKEAILRLDINQDYESEINLNLSGWIKSMSDSLEKGVVLLIDYGFPQHEYYHLDRSMGTLMCHYRHLTHIDPFLYPGLQDITAHVNFTAVAEAAIIHNLQVGGFTHQAAFLLACGLLDFTKENLENNLSINHQIKKLTHVNEMGELFKVIALTKGLDLDLLGFTFHDQRYRL